MTEMIKLKGGAVALLVAAAIIPWGPGPRADSDSLAINISGTITESSCSVNNNQAITVEFGTVQVAELTKASASVPVTIACDSAPSGTVSMGIEGTASTFDSLVLATDVSGLGISFEGTKQNSVVSLNTFYDVSDEFGLTSKTGTFNLTARLISDGATTLAGGEFNASATLVLQMS